MICSRPPPLFFPSFSASSASSFSLLRFPLLLLRRLLRLLLRLPLLLLRLLLLLLLLLLLRLLSRFFFFLLFFLLFRFACFSSLCSVWKRCAAVDNCISLCRLCASCRQFCFVSCVTFLVVERVCLQEADDPTASGTAARATTCDGLLPAHVVVPRCTKMGDFKRHASPPRPLQQSTTMRSKNLSLAIITSHHHECTLCNVATPELGCLRARQPCHASCRRSRALEPPTLALWRTSREAFTPLHSKLAGLRKRS